VGGLNSADYVVVSSNRVRESVAKLPAEYPATNLYYQLLDSGALGFEPVAEFQVHPTFLGVSVDDSKSEESFTVYDHPTVRIYARTTAFDPAKAMALLETAHPERAINLLPKQGRTNGLQLTASEAATQQGGGTFSDVFDADGWASSLPWLWWFLWLEVAAFAAVPWVTWLCRALPDRGYGLSKLLGSCAVVVPVWMLVAWGGPHFSGTLAWSVLGVAVAAGAALGWRRRASLIAEVRESWRMWVVVEAVFVAAFAAFLLLRAFNPDLWFDPLGGEKPMDIAYLTAVTRSTTLPPYDPWFGGGSMNYYYMGWFFLAVPIRAFRIVPEVAFNLGIPTFAAMGATVAYSTVYNLVGLGRRAREAGAAARRRWQRPALFAGLLGAVLLIGIGNLDGAHQTIERLQAVNDWSLLSGVPVLGGLVGIVGGAVQWVGGASLPPFDWWRSSRVHFGSFDITEFPYFSLLFADLHPQLMDVPFFGLVIALGLAYVATVRSALRAQGGVLAGAIGLAIGLVRTVHTWDFPTAVLLGGGAIVVAQLVREGRWQERWWAVVAHGSVAAAMLVVPFAPYTAHFETFDPGLVRSPETTQPQQYFAQYGLFVAFALVFLAVRYAEELRWRRRDHGQNPFLAAVNGRLELGALAVFVIGLGAFAFTFGLTTLALAVLLLCFLLNLVWLEFERPDRQLGRLLATVMFALAFAISAGVDVVTLKNDIERMNTVFKFGLQAWQLFALASAYSAWYSGRALWRVRDWRVRARDGRSVAAVGATAVLAGLVFGAGIFVVAGTSARQNARFGGGGPTLDGLGFMATAQYREAFNANNPTDDVTINLQDDRPLIDWLRENVQGSPVIAEEVGPLYHWTGRMSEYTGLPSVIGWDWHQIQQRTDYQGLVDARRFDTEQFYAGTSGAAAEQYLLKYNVRYVVVGTEEYAHVGDGVLAKFAAMPSLKEVFASGRYRIYEVDQSKLPPPQ
jgi:YYY domain-containing protein